MMQRKTIGLNRKPSWKGGISVHLTKLAIMDNSAMLWSALLEAISWKNSKKREKPSEIFNVLANEYVPGLPRLGPESCRIRADTWKPEQLRMLTTTRPESTPNCETKPIILFRNRGSDHVIDGNRRLNLWKLKNDQYNHKVIIVELNGGK